MDAEITKLDGTTFSFEEQGIRITDFIVSSLPIQSEYETIEGRDRRVDKGATFGPRTIRTPFYFEAYDLLDWPLFRDYIFSLVLEKEPFYIREKRRMSHRPYKYEIPGQEKVINTEYLPQYIGGKRYLVRLQNTFDLDQIYKNGKGSFTFETVELPFAESIGTTQDIQSSGLTSESELWGFGMGLSDDPDSLVYTHEGKTSFRIFNAGNLPIHPFDQDLKITISNVVGSTEYFELKNKTNNTAFHVNEAVSNIQTIVIDGPIVKSNGLAFLRSTNKQFIELVPGWNDFEITGATSAKVEFDFRFYYK